MSDPYMKDLADRVAAFGRDVDDYVARISKLKDEIDREETRISILEKASRLTSIERAKVASAMQRYGGSFVRQLGLALYLADSDNAKRIKNAFPEYWEKYAKMADEVNAVTEDRA